MESQQIVDYIADNLAVGHAEADIRAQLQASGWSQASVDGAFSHYRQLHNVVLQPAAKHTRRRIRWPKLRIAPRVLQAGAGLAVLAVLALGAYVLWPHKPAPAVVHAAPLSYQQKQSNDVNIIAGAMGQYVAGSGGVVPTSISAAADGNLVLCGVTCDPTTSNISPLSVYRASGIEFVAYDAALTAPDKYTMYLVLGGSCISVHELGPQSTNPHAVVILYGRDTGTDLVQRCVTL